MRKFLAFDLAASILGVIGIYLSIWRHHDLFFLSIVLFFTGFPLTSIFFKNSINNKEVRSK